MQHKLSHKGIFTLSSKYIAVFKIPLNRLSENNLYVLMCVVIHVMDDCNRRDPRLVLLVAGHQKV